MGEVEGQRFELRMGHGGQWEAICKAKWSGDKVFGKREGEMGELGKREGGKGEGKERRDFEFERLANSRHFRPQQCIAAHTKPKNSASIEKRTNAANSFC